MGANASKGQGQGQGQTTEQYDKSGKKTKWVDDDFSKDDSIKPLDMPTGYDTVYKEPEVKESEVKESDNSIIIIILVIILILGSAGGAAFIFMQKKP